MPRKKKTETAEKVKEKKVREKKVRGGRELKEKREKVKKEIKEKDERIERLKEKAKELAEKIEGEERIRAEDIKPKISKKEDTLFPLDDYVRYSAHLGTKAVTPMMRQFVYRRRADGIAVLNTNSIDEKLKEAAEFLADFQPEDIFLACKREAGWRAAKKFSEVTGIRVFTKKYAAGIITNPELDGFFETELVIVCDPWLDKNALNDTVRVKKPVIGLCDTNNLTKGLTKIIPCNNKAEKSIGLILYLLAREYLKARREKEKLKNLNVDDFTGKIETEKRERGAEQGV